MSRSIKLSDLTSAQRKTIHADLTLEIKDTYSGTQTSFDVIYELSDESQVRLPFAYGSFVERKPTTEIHTFKASFQGTLREHQVPVKTEVIQSLNKYHSFILSAYTGFGKTITSVYIISTIGYKTLIIINRKVLINQWIESVNKYCPNLKVLYLEPKKVNQEKIAEADILIVNAINIPKFDQTVFAKIGFVVVDEIHLITSKVLYKGLFCIQPRFLLGLSATPYRYDSYDKVIEFFFGTHRKFIPMQRTDMKVYTLKTDFSPEVKKLWNGKMDWNHTLQSIANDATQNELIVELVKKHPTRVIFIPLKRISQAEYLTARLKEEKENVSCYIKNATTYDANARVFIGIINKVGVGFDHPTLDMMILAADIVDYFIQLLGRIGRSSAVSPIVFDIVHNNGVLKKHYLERESVYRDVSATIEKHSANMYLKSLK